MSNKLKCFKHDRHVMVISKTLGQTPKVVTTPTHNTFGVMADGVVRHRSDGTECAPILDEVLVVSGTYIWSVRENE